MSKRMLILMCTIFLVVPLAFMGCSGDDGAAGPQGPQGLQGPRGEDLTANPTPETCSVCHQSIAATHAQKGIVTVGSVASARDGGGNLVTTFNVKVDGVNSDSFILYRAYLHFDNAAQAVPAGSATPMITTGQRNALYSLADNGVITGSATWSSNGSGNYTVTVPAANVIDNADYLFIVKASAGTAAETVVSRFTLEGSAFATLGTTSLRDLVSDDGCNSCHGPTPAWSEKFRHYAVGGSKCQVCHSIVGRSVGIITLLDNGTRVETLPFRSGTNAVEYFHGIHNSEGMPDNAYFRSTNPAGGENSYAIGYPSDMRNCKVCHTEPAQLTAASTAPVSFWLCMTCHQSWKSFPNAPTGHAAYTDNTNCAATCHNGTIARATVSDFHNSFEGTDAHYDSFYNGTDISFDNPDNVLFTVTGVQKSGDNVAFTWTASKLGAAVDPCNTDNAAGPTFRALGAYLAYAKGDDWVNENLSASQAPGQPLSAKNLFTSLSTTCDNTTKVATTTGLVVAEGAKPYAKKALLAIGGKPLTRHSTGEFYFVRVASPTYAFSMATGDSVAARRSAVDTAKCIKCHRGTLYQHGGDRVDNEQLCVICHNPSSSEKNVRVGYGILNADNTTVNISATYDGKSAETYDMRYLLHSIHGAEKRDNPIIIYRGRGIFAFAAEGAAKPAGWPTGAGPQPIAGSTTGATQTHTWTIIDYPKPVNACEACHVAGLYEVPDQTKAVALTVEPGTSWPSQTDDVSIGPAAAACTACHADSVTRSHAVKQGYMANVLKEVMLEMADPAAWWLPPTP